MPVHSKFASRPLLWIAAALTLAFIGLQFIRPRLANPPVTADLQAPSEVKQILKTSCYNCHSNETKLSWFDLPVPAYWLVASDVRAARNHLNFSEIGNLPAAQQKAILFESVSQIQLGAMPLPQYRLLHPESAVNRAQLAVLKNYLSPATPLQPASAEAVSAASAEYQTWVQTDSALPPVLPAPNGIAFMPDYKNWKAISSTERFDNRTMREILGNDVAIQAIADRRINPWPDGTIFAKVAWWQQPDDKGVAHTGAFFQVEFMIRDRKKYAKTLGWGWARWRGPDLKPFGKDASFTRECVSCHLPLRDNDYVYTLPIGGQQ